VRAPAGASILFYPNNVEDYGLDARYSLVRADALRVFRIVFIKLPTQNRLRVTPTRQLHNLHLASRAVEAGAQSGF
jgi:hypothetical protein